MKGKVFGAIGVIVFAFLVWFFGSDVSIDHSQEQQIGSWNMTTGDEVKIKELRAKQADLDIQLQEAKKQKEELNAQLQTLNWTIEQIREARRNLDIEVAAIINWPQQEVIYQSTGAVLTNSGEVKAELFQ